MSNFDIRSALLKNKDMFEPFHARTTRRLQDMVAAGHIKGRVSVLVMEREREALVLLTHQMTYHHVAQGEISGRPWMVSF